MILTDRASSPRLLISPILRAVRTAPQTLQRTLGRWVVHGHKQPLPGLRLRQRANVRGRQVDAALSGLSILRRHCPAWWSMELLQEKHTPSNEGRHSRDPPTLRPSPACGPSKPNRRRVLTRGLPPGLHATSGVQGFSEEAAHHVVIDDPTPPTTINREALGHPSRSTIYWHFAVQGVELVGAVAGLGDSSHAARTYRMNRQPSARPA
jgi:hypothetical protein